MGSRDSWLGNKPPVGQDKTRQQTIGRMRQEKMGCGQTSSALVKVTMSVGITIQNNENRGRDCIFLVSSSLPSSFSCVWDGRQTGAAS